MTYRNACRFFIPKCKIRCVLYFYCVHFSYGHKDPYIKRHNQDSPFFSEGAIICHVFNQLVHCTYTYILIVIKTHLWNVEENKCQIVWYFLMKNINHNVKMYMIVECIFYKLQNDHILTFETTTWIPLCITLGTVIFCL